MADPLQVSMPSLPITAGLLNRQPRVAPAKAAPPVTSYTPEFVTAERMAPALEEQRNVQQGLLTQADQAEVEAKRLEGERNVARAEEKMRLRQEEATAFQNAPQQQELKTARDELKNAAFVPSKANAQDIATMFSLVGLIGMAIGGGGKVSAFNAMGAMNGMLEGYQKGRLDLYKKEKDVFEKNIKLMQNKVAILQSELQEAAQTFKTNRELGEQQAEIAFAKADSPILEAMAKRQGIMRTLENVNATAKDMQTLVGLLNKEEETKYKMAIDERNFQEQVRARKVQEDMRREAIALRRDLTNNKGLKPPAKIQETYVADNQLRKDLSELRNKLQDPKLVAQLKQYRVESFLSEEGGKAISQVMQTSIPPELRSFLTQVRDMRNNYYLTISGKAVTGGEALRNYGVVPQPGDTQEMMLDKIGGMERRVDQKIAAYQGLYNLPDIRDKFQPGMPTMLNPGENYSIGASETPAAPTQRAMLRGREIIVRDGKWVFSDTGEDAK
jgi:hypothetical protein